jgi:phosphocarrier protein FPr
MADIPTAGRGAAAMSSSRVTLVAPVSGYVIPIDQVPDPVFASKMVGDGVAIDPLTTRLVAPCDGTVRQVHPSGHAVAVGTAGGLEVLMHVGLDTVQLRGDGFTVRVKAGDAVKTGDVLIEFDADRIAQKARSMLTEIVITTPDRVASLARRSGRVEAGRDPILDVALAAVEAAPTYGGDEAVSEPIVLPNPAGMHARPAAVLASLAKRFRSRVCLRKGGAEANARSLVDVLALQIGCGDAIAAVARGEVAREAIAAILPAVRQGLGDELGGGRPAAPAAGPPGRDSDSRPPEPRRNAALPPADPDRLRGAPASPGVAIGRIHKLRERELPVRAEGEGPVAERRKLDSAIDTGRAQIDALRVGLESGGDPARAAILAAHGQLLEDPSLLELATRDIERGRSAAFAWREAFTAHADRLAALPNELLAARAADLRDVGRRVLGLLVGATSEREPVPEESLLIAEELAPSDTARLDRSRVLGFATTRGGATSHVAILARSLGIPAIAGIDPHALDVPEGTPAVLDGSSGLLRLRPPLAEVERVRGDQERLARKRRAEREAAAEPAVTRDGHRVEVVANAGSIDDARQALELGGEGVGLLRTEFLFMERDSAPDEGEQAKVYGEIAALLGPERPLVIRLLDVGGDKPLSYLPVPHEENPFLGQRGLRLLLERADLLRDQMRAILRASSKGKVLAMLPMVADPAEWTAARAAWEEEAAALGVPPAPLGIMIEVPSAALMAEVLAREAAFFSVGSNDLTQYTLAMDRGHPKLAPQIDGLHPSVLALIARTVDGAHRHGRWVGVCGGIASDEQAVPLLIGLGVDELSVPVPALPAIKARVRGLERAACQDLARRAVEAVSAAAVRALVGDAGEGR